MPYVSYTLGGYFYQTTWVEPPTPTPTRTPVEEGVRVGVLVALTCQAVQECRRVPRAQISPITEADPTAVRGLIARLGEAWDRALDLATATGQHRHYVVLNDIIGEYRAAEKRLRQLLNGKI